MENKQTKVLTEYEKKFIELEVKRTKKINEYLATTQMDVAFYKKPKTKKGTDKNDKN